MNIAAFLHRRRVPLSIAATLAVLTLAFLALHHLLREISYHQIRVALRALGPSQFVPAIWLTALSYLALTGYDYFALRTIGRPLPYRTAALASFTAYTLSHNLGLAALTGGSARYRYYTEAGLGVSDVARVILLVGLAFWVGVVTLLGVALIVQPGALRINDWTAPYALQATIGGVLLALVVAYGLLGWRRQGAPLKVRGWALPLPTPKIMLTTLALSCIDLPAATGTLFVLVPHATAGAFPAFFIAYIVALLAALLTHTPGGLGVFEAVLLVTLPGVPQIELVSALIVYRLTYYILPLLIAAAIAALNEGSRWRQPVGRVLDDVRGAATEVAPAFLAALGLIGGGVLLVSGAIPAMGGRLKVLEAVVPLPFIEASHLAASLTGTALIMLAPGLYRRLDGAFFTTRALLAAGAIFSLVKGIDYEEATILCVILALLQWTRPAFYRRTAMTAEPFSRGGLLAAAVAVAVASWIGFFAYRHVEYDDALWWSFSLHGNASRFLRATLAASVLVMWFVGQRLFSAPRADDAACDLPPDVAERAFALTSRTEASLAYTGDKRFLIAPSRDAFLMYQVQGRTWAALGDPVGSEEARADLMWRFKEAADAHQGRAAFYQLSQDSLPLAIDLGLALFKLGEEARVDLSNFDLSGPRGKPFRHAERRMAEAGATFEIVPAASVPAILGDLERVSDAWREDKRAPEKRFSLGRFDADYLARFDCAVVRIGGCIVAFANLWATANHEELSVDLMRHAPDASAGMMDFLFSQLMLWGRAQGYRWFNLGMAPLGGFEARRSSPWWPKLASFIYRHGGDLYGFQGLRAYKDKFDPEWRPRYLACDRGAGFARTMLDITTLISGGRLSASRR